MYATSRFSPVALPVDNLATMKNCLFLPSANQYHPELPGEYEAPLSGALSV